MIKKISLENKMGNERIKILYPGIVMEGSGDSGLASIGRIDHANIPKDTIVRMHPHVNDEILSYFRSGNTIHTDSEGFEASITRNKLMLMKAGKLFYHEEKMTEDLEGLQIFIRPMHKDLEPEVIFHDLEEADSINQWRLLASPTNETSLQFSSQTWIYDTALDEGKTIELPNDLKSELTGLVYVFQGKVELNNGMTLLKGEAVLFKNEEIQIIGIENSELVLFFTDEKSEYYDEGMYSGKREK